MPFYESFDKKELIAAHRGWRTIRPENTIAAFEAAVGHFDFIELDLQLTKDDVFIVMHDASLERTTDAALKFPNRKAPYLVADFTLDEIERLDAGSWFLKSDPFGSVANGRVDPKSLDSPKSRKIPTLQETLRFGAAFNMPLNLEIKRMPHRSCEEGAKIFLKELEEFGSTVTVLVSSFDHSYIKRIKEEAPQTAAAALFAKSLPIDLEGYLLNLKAEACHAETALAPEVPVSKLLKKGISSALYTVNDKNLRKELFRRGFRALFADEP